MFKIRKIWEDLKEETPIRKNGVPRKKGVRAEWTIAGMMASKGGRWKHGIQDRWEDSDATSEPEVKKSGDLRKNIKVPK